MVLSRKSPRKRRTKSFEARESVISYQTLKNITMEHWNFLPPRQKIMDHGQRVPSRQGRIKRRPPRIDCGEKWIMRKVRHQVLSSIDRSTNQSTPYKPASQRCVYIYSFTICSARNDLTFGIVHGYHIIMHLFTLTSCYCCYYCWFICDFKLWKRQKKKPKHCSSQLRLASTTRMKISTKNWSEPISWPPRVLPYSSHLVMKQFQSPPLQQHSARSNHLY